MTDRDSIGSRILGNDKKRWSSANLDTTTLPDRIGKCSLMLPEDLTCCREDISFLFFDTFSEKFAHRYLSDKTKSLRIFAFCIGESYIPRDSTYLTFFEMPDREHRMRELEL
jgi:hypothetical protein